MRDDAAEADMDRLAALAAEAQRCLDELGSESTAEDGRFAEDQRRSFSHNRQMLSHQTHLLLAEYDRLSETDNDDRSHQREDHVHKVRQQRGRLEAHLAEIRAYLAAQRHCRAERSESADHPEPEADHAPVAINEDSYPPAPPRRALNITDGVQR